MVALPPRRIQWLAVALVPFSSFFGLLRPQLEIQGEGNMYWNVWSQNFWGDVIFVAATLAAAWLTWRVMDRLRAQGLAFMLGAGMVVGFLLHWVAYALAWSVTGANKSFWGLAVSFYEDSYNVFSFTLDWGWIGLVASALLFPLACQALTTTRPTQPAQGAGPA